LVFLKVTKRCPSEKNKSFQLDSDVFHAAPGHDIAENAATSLKVREQFPGLQGSCWQLISHSCRVNYSGAKFVLRESGRNQLVVSAELHSCFDQRNAEK